MGQKKQQSSVPWPTMNKVRTRSAVVDPDLQIRGEGAVIQTLRQGGGGPSLRASVWSSPGSATGKDKYFLNLKHFPFVLTLMVSFIRYLWIHFFLCTRFAPRSLVTSLGVGVTSQHQGWREANFWKSRSNVNKCHQHFYSRCLCSLNFSYQLII